MLTVFSCLLVLSSLSAAVSHASSTSQNSASQAGYEIFGPTNSVTLVEGSWFVPTVKSSCTSAQDFVSLEGVAIDSTQSLGRNPFATTDQLCQVGKFQYVGVVGGLTGSTGSSAKHSVNAGDKMIGIIKYKSGIWTLTLQDLTAKWTISIHGTANHANLRNEADWLLFGPNGCPMGGISTIQSGLKYTSVSATDYATMGTHTGSIGSFASISGYDVTQVTMVQSGNPIATPSSLQDGGTSFTISSTC